MDEILIKFLPTATSLFRVGLTLSIKSRVRKVEKIGPDLIVGHFFLQKLRLGELVAQPDELCIDIWISVLIICLSTQITERQGTAFSHHQQGRKEGLPILPCAGEPD